MIKKLFVTLALLIAVWGPANAFSEKLQIVATDRPPFEMLGENGQITGIHVDIIREFCKRNGIEADFRILPWPRALDEVKEGRAAAVSSPRKTEERTQFLIYPSEYFTMERTVIVGLKEKGIKASKLDDLKNKTCGVVRAYVYPPQFDNYSGLKKDESTDNIMMIRKLGEHRTELAVGEQSILLFIAKNLGIQIETVFVLVDAEPDYFAFSKTLGEKGRILAEKFNQTIRQLRQEGFITKTYDKYLK
jgi:polar amino acid transport system substrate-binding protein